jgi:hypothetical protein
MNTYHHGLTGEQWAITLKQFEQGWGTQFSLIVFRSRHRKTDAERQAVASVHRLAKTMLLGIGQQHGVDGWDRAAAIAADLSQGFALLEMELGFLRGMGGHKKASNMCAHARRVFRKFAADMDAHHAAVDAMFNTEAT